MLFEFMVNLKMYNLFHYLFYSYACAENTKRHQAATHHDIGWTSK
jgi:hypothetical protein